MTFDPTTPELSTNGRALGTHAAVGEANHVVPQEVRNFLSDVEHLIEETTSITGEDLARAKARLVERITAARNSVAETGEQLAQGARHKADVANRYVHDRPWTVIGLAAVLGCLVGLGLARRNRMSAAAG